MILMQLYLGVSGSGVLSKKTGFLEIWSQGESMPSPQNPSNSLGLQLLCGSLSCDQRKNQRPLRTPKKESRQVGPKNPPNYPTETQSSVSVLSGKVDTIPLENEVTWRSVSSLKDFNNNKNRNFPAILDDLCESVSHPYASKTWHASL